MSLFILERRDYEIKLIFFNLNDQEEALDLLKLRSLLPHAGRSQPVLRDTNLQGGSWSSRCIVHERMAAISFTLGPVPAELPQGGNSALRF